MADQGSIGRTFRNAFRRTVGHATHDYVAARPLPAPDSFSRVIPIWAAATADAHKVPVGGSLSGTVAENGVGVPFAWVCVYYRATGNFIARVQADASGSFSLSGILDTTDAAAYFAVALDPDSGVQYNALIFDRLTAV